MPALLPQFRAPRYRAASTSRTDNVVAVRYEGGVVMAGDRRATSGNFISHRRIEKVFAADHHSGVGIAGAAGPAMEMVKLSSSSSSTTRRSREIALSLEGKANQLGRMVRDHLPAAMQGMAVVPMFAGYDGRERSGACSSTT